MASSLAGLLTLAYAPNFTILLIGGILLGLGSAIFHPEASRIARLASGGRHGLAQSIFQVVAISAPRSGRSPPPLSCCREGRLAWPGSPWQR